MLPGLEHENVTCAAQRGLYFMNRVTLLTGVFTLV